VSFLAALDGPGCTMEPEFHAHGGDIMMKHVSQQIRFLLVDLDETGVFVSPDEFSQQCFEIIVGTDGAG